MNIIYGNNNQPLYLSKYYMPGLGYSNASGPPTGGFGVNANPYIYSSTFFGSDIKGLLPPTNMFGKSIKKSIKRQIKKRKKKQKSKKLKKNYLN